MRRARAPGGAWVGFGVAVFVIPVPLGAAEVTVERIWQSLRERDENVETAQISWLYDLVISRDMAASSVAPAGGLQKRNTDEAPMTLGEHESSLSLKGKRIRLEFVAASFAQGNRGVAAPSISAYDGQFQRQFTERTGSVDHHWGSINPAVFDGWQGIHVVPLFYALHPLHPQVFGSGPKQWRLEPDPAVIDGRRCVIISRHTRHPGSKYRLSVFLDPARDFVPLRRESYVNGNLSTRVDMTYVDGSEHSWLPARWTSTDFGNTTGRVLKRSDNRVTEVALNEPLPDDHFRFEFPAGTVVTDKRQQEAQRFFVEEDGSWVPYEKGRTPATPVGRSWTTWTWLAVLVAGAVTLGIWFHKRLYRVRCF